MHTDSSFVPSRPRRCLRCYWGDRVLICVQCVVAVAAWFPLSLDSSISHETWWLCIVLFPQENFPYLSWYHNSKREHFISVVAKSPAKIWHTVTHSSSGGGLSQHGFCYFVSSCFSPIQTFVVLWFPTKKMCAENAAKLARVKWKPSWTSLLLHQLFPLIMDGCTSRLDLLSL